MEALLSPATQHTLTPQVILAQTPLGMQQIGIHDRRHAHSKHPHDLSLSRPANRLRAQTGETDQLIAPLQNFNPLFIYLQIRF